jgi:hypothetical protein
MILIYRFLGAGKMGIESNSCDWSQTALAAHLIRLAQLQSSEAATFRIQLRVPKTPFCHIDPVKSSRLSSGAGWSWITGYSSIAARNCPREARNPSSGRVPGDPARIIDQHQLARREGLLSMASKRIRGSTPAPQPTHRSAPHVPRASQPTEVMRAATVSWG